MSIPELQRPSTSHRRRFYTLQIFRAVFGVIAGTLLSRVVDVGIAPLWIDLAIVAGVVIGGVFILRGIRVRVVALAHSAIAVALLIVLRIADWLSATTAQDANFTLDLLGDQLVTIGLLYLVALSLTILFWKVRSIPTWEAAIGFLSGIWIFSGHRNYQLDAPQNVSNLAFHLHIEPQHFLLGIGAALLGFIAIYLFLSERRPIFRPGENTQYAPGRVQHTTALMLLAGFVILFYGIATVINDRYRENLSRASEGVGQNSDEGQSPLGFHSAVGKTLQPAALVRLESDYKANPLQPMLYFREGALSEFNGHEFVLATPQFDSDTPRVAPGQVLSLPNDPNIQDGERSPVVQSIYLLTKHTTIFAIDRPESIRLIKNPDPQRFNTTYQALSLAPVFPMETLVGRRVGSEKWSESTWRHYLRTPGSRSKEARGQDTTPMPTFDTPVVDSFREDLRYEYFAQQLVEGLNDPVQRAAAIVRYLSQESIYTRQPGHPPSEDPVAPYLFGKTKRGYCVHFAHAATYLFRSLGIPARIATGYLTDTTYAKDGHILLHIGDRHAWPEIYVQGFGWVVMDVVPAQAENEQAIIPDEKLLDELMSKLDPAEQFIPPEIVAQTSTRSDFAFPELVTRRGLLALLFGAVVLWLATKLTLGIGFRLAQNARRRVRYAYASAASQATDLGVEREEGETRRDFAQRVERILGGDFLPLTILQEQLSYRDPRLARFDTAMVDDAYKRFHSGLAARTPLWRRFLATLNVRSIFRVGRW